MADNIISFDFEGQKCKAYITFGVLVEFDALHNGDGSSTFPETLKKLEGMKGLANFLFIGHDMYCEEKNIELAFTKRRAADAFTNVDQEAFIKAIERMVTDIEKKMNPQPKQKKKARPSKKSIEDQSEED